MRGGRRPIVGMPTKRMEVRQAVSTKQDSWCAPRVPVRAPSHPASGADAPFPGPPIRLDLGSGSVPEAVPGGDKWYPGIDLHRPWNVEKERDPKLAWWNENSRCVHDEAFRHLDRALQDFIAAKKGTRKDRLGSPREKKGRCRDSFRFSTGVMRFSGATITLPRLGTIRTQEATDALSRKLAEGRARILSATVSRTAQRRVA
jgi:hypothetical protein